MPKFQDYPAITTMASADKLLVHQALSGAEKTILFSDFNTYANGAFTGGGIVRLSAELSIASGAEGAVNWGTAIRNDGGLVWYSATPHVLFFPPTANKVIVTMEARWKTGAGDNLGRRDLKIKTYGAVGENWGVDLRTAVGALTADATVSTMALKRADVEAIEGTFTAWAPSTAYVALTGANVTVGMASYNGKNYGCITSHTSGASFDPTFWREAPLFYVTVQQTSGSAVLLRTPGTKFSLQSFL